MLMGSSLGKSPLANNAILTVLGFLLNFLVSGEFPNASGSVAQWLGRQSLAGRLP